MDRVGGVADVRARRSGRGHPMSKNVCFVVAGLAIVAAISSGCTSCPHHGAGGAKNGPRPFDMTYPGVVEIYRNNDMNQVVGYCSQVKDTTDSWWLLNDGESPPVLPRNDNEVYVTFKRVSDKYMDGQTLCDTYGSPNYNPPLVNPKIWFVSPDDPTNCVPQGLKR
jgi:hypothetical protein